MKVISIGRNPSSDIFIEDPMVSRRHAALRIHSFGKIEVIDYSQNGTTVNSRRIKSNAFYPVKRGDEIVFADSVSLDWSIVPKPKGWIITIVSVTVALLISILTLIYYQFLNNAATDGEEEIPQQIDSLNRTVPGTDSPTEILPGKTESQKTNIDSFINKLLDKEKKKYDIRHEPNESDRPVVEKELDAKPLPETEPQAQINPYL